MNTRLKGVCPNSIIKQLVSKVMKQADATLIYMVEYRDYFSIYSPVRLAFHHQLMLQYFLELTHCVLLYCVILNKGQ